MSNEKVPWMYVSIGWVAGAIVARLTQGFATNSEQFLAIVAMVMLPFVIHWLREMSTIFKHRPNPPSGD